MSYLANAPPTLALDTRLLRRALTLQWVERVHSAATASGTRAAPSVR